MKDERENVHLQTIRHDREKEREKKWRVVLLIYCRKFTQITVISIKKHFEKKKVKATSKAAIMICNHFMIIFIWNSKKIIQLYFYCENWLIWICLIISCVCATTTPNGTMESSHVRNKNYNSCKNKCRLEVVFSHVVFFHLDELNRVVQSFYMNFR